MFSPYRNAPSFRRAGVPAMVTHITKPATTQRRFRHTPKSWSAPLRLKTPLTNIKAVRAHRLQQEVERLQGTRFSGVAAKPKAVTCTVKPQAPIKHSLVHSRALDLATPGSFIISNKLKFFRRGLKKRISSPLGCDPVDLQQSILFIDLANCGGRLHVRHLDKSVNVIASIFKDLVQFSSLRGCQVFVMV